MKNSGTLEHEMVIMVFGKVGMFEFTAAIEMRAYNVACGNPYFI